MKTHTLSVGLIGYGMSGRTLHAPLIQATPGLELTAVVSGDADKVHADLPDVEVMAKSPALLARRDIDLVVIATPNETHYPLARAALAAGKHLVIDKPFTVSTGFAPRSPTAGGTTTSQEAGSGSTWGPICWTRRGPCSACHGRSFWSSPRCAMAPRWTTISSACWSMTACG